MSCAYVGPLVDATVVIPTRNRHGLLSEAIQSALWQEDISIEVLVVDDASTDDTPQLLARLDDSRVRVLRHERSMGVAAARNSGAAHARGECVAFLDDDDLWAPRWLHTAIAAIHRDDAGAAYGSRWVINRRRDVIGAWPAADPDHVRAHLSSHNAMGSPSAVVVRRDVLERIGGFDERLSALADWEAWIRILAVCGAVGIPEFLVGYTVYADNMSARDPTAVLAEFGVLQEIASARTELEQRIDGSLFMRELAQAASRNGHRRTAARLWGRCARVTRRPEDLLRAGWSLLRDDSHEVRYVSPDWLAGFSPIGASDAAAGEMRVSDEAVAEA